GGIPGYDRQPDQKQLYQRPAGRYGSLFLPGLHPERGILLGGTGKKRNTGGDGVSPVPQKKPPLCQKSGGFVQKCISNQYQLGVISRVYSQLSPAGSSHRQPSPSRVKVGWLPWKPKG